MMQSCLPSALKNGYRGRLIDVRNFDEFTAERLPEAECIPLDRLMAAAGAWDTQAPLIVMCKSGQRSAEAARKLREAGFADVATLDGGIDACKKAGLEVIRERRRIPLYRQVMVVAGLMLLVGLGLSLSHGSWIALSWFVGLGLVFGGATGYCPMAALLARMPWNQEPDCTSKCCNEG